jgi:hypothetical protein
VARNHRQQLDHREERVRKGRHERRHESLSFTPKNVIVQTFTISTEHTGHGDIPATIRLARFALRHLHAARR